MEIKIIEMASNQQVLQGAIGAQNLSVFNNLFLANQLYSKRYDMFHFQGNTKISCLPCNNITSYSLHWVTFYLQSLEDNIR